MKTDYLFLYRRIKRSTDFRDGTDRLLFEDLLLAAAYEDRTVEIAGLKVVEAAGSVYVSRATIRGYLGDWCTLSPTAILRRLSRLEKTGCIKLTPSASATLIEFPRWADYQADKNRARNPQPQQRQRKPGKKSPTTRRGERAQGDAQGSRPCARPENAQPPEADGGPTDGGFLPERAQGKAQGSHPCARPENAQPTIKERKEGPFLPSTKPVLLGPGPVLSTRDQTGPEGGQEEADREGTETVREVCREIERIAGEWGAGGVNTRKEAAREMVRAALEGDYPCERLPAWPPRRVYTLAEIVEAARWFYADRMGRAYGAEGERRRALQIRWLLGVNKVTGDDALAEALRKARRAPQIAPSPRRLEIEEALEQAELERKSRRRALLHGTALPPERDAQQIALRELLYSDETWSRWNLRVVELQAEIGQVEGEVVEAERAFYRERFGETAEAPVDRV